MNRRKTALIAISGIILLALVIANSLYRPLPPPEVMPEPSKWGEPPEEIPDLPSPPTKPGPPPPPDPYKIRYWGMINWTTFRIVEYEYRATVVIYIENLGTCDIHGIGFPDYSFPESAVRVGETKAFWLPDSRLFKKSGTGDVLWFVSSLYCDEKLGPWQMVYQYAHWKFNLHWDPGETCSKIQTGILFAPPYH